MAKYAILMHGHGIHLEGVFEDLATGFVAVRAVKAREEQAAIQRATIELLQDWKSLFNRDNRSGTPTIELIKTKRVYNPFRTFQLPDDFVFYSNEDEKAQALQSALKLFV